MSGVAWMDHQWGNFVVGAVGGWDWYSVQLDDRTELMLYVLRAPTGETSAVYGTQVLADGSTRDLGTRQRARRGDRSLDEPAHRRRLPLRLGAHLAGR